MKYHDPFEITAPIDRNAGRKRTEKRESVPGYASTLGMVAPSGAHCISFLTWEQVRSGFGGEDWRLACESVGLDDPDVNHYDPTRGNYVDAGDAWDGIDHEANMIAVCDSMGFTDDDANSNSGVMLEEPINESESVQDNEDAPIELPEYTDLRQRAVAESKLRLERSRMRRLKLGRTDKWCYGTPMGSWKTHRPHQCRSVGRKAVEYWGQAAAA